MEQENYGSLLREARERRCVSLTDISRKTKVPASALALLESGRLDGLPADVFVRGFIRSYAKHVGISEVEPLGLYQKAVDDRRRAEESAVSQPRAPMSASGRTDAVATEQAQVQVPVDDGQQDGAQPRRGIGLAVFVIIVLLIATITWSIFLRQTPQSGEGLSSLPVLPGAPAELDARPATTPRRIG
jgi:cytoskeletal protein RodZ